MMGIGACNTYQEEQPAGNDPAPAAGPENQTENTISPNYRYSNTSMFLTDNGMILMFGADRPGKYNDSCGHLLNPALNQPERGGKIYFHHKVP